jgi:3'-5' exoribonuclease
LETDTKNTETNPTGGRQWLIDLRPKEDIEEIYLVKAVTRQEAKDGKPYLVISLTDASGEMDCRIWHDVDQEFKKVNKGDFVKVQGKVNFFQGKRQLVIQQLMKVDAKTVKSEDFIVRANLPADRMYAELMGIVRELDDPYIGQLLDQVLQDDEIKRRLMLWQAGKSVHHAYQAGLLEHILSCAHLAFNLSDHYRVNKNYVVAGAILHDLAKVYELTEGPLTDYTEEGKLIGHLIKGIELLDRFCYRIKNFPYPIRMHLKHLLVSHHGEYAFGSPKLPQTAEAMLLHLIDLMDSRMNMFESTRRFDALTGNWSMFVKHLDRPVFKGELPSGHDFEPPPSASASVVSTSIPIAKPVAQAATPKELKQSLGDLLQQYKKEKPS